MKQSLVVSLSLVSLVSLALLSLLGGRALAQSPANSSVIPADALGSIILSPDLPIPIPASRQLITVRDAANNPMPGVPVQVSFSNAFTLCANGIFSGVTNAQGQVTLVMAGGGCSIQPSVRVVANGIVLRTFTGKSPDFDGATGDKSVGLADLVYFSNCLFGGGCRCHDYDNNGQMNLGDLVVFSAAFANSCP